MKLPYSWLRQLSGVGWPPEEMADRLTRSGTAGVVSAFDPEHFRHVVTGRIVNLTRHPRADRLVIAEVDTGGTIHKVICGAPNCQVGQVVPLALPGARLRGEFEVKEIVMRGVPSAGMICAEDELGLSDDHSGIMVFDPETELNRPVFEHLGLDDPVIEFEITPNRPDCLCAAGIAREISVLAGKSFAPDIHPPTECREKISDFVKVVIDDPDACPRYSARLIRNLTIGPSPDWLKRRLVDCGVRPINNIVDVTNLVMLETGQPLHAFDYNRFGSDTVVVRRAKPAERFTTLDGQEHHLDEDILLITNGRRAVAAAGVMGGLDSEVTDETTTILLESAYFKPSVIRRSRKKLGLSSESSYRFERGVDPNGVVRAADRAAALMAELSGGEVLSGVADNYRQPINPLVVTLRPERVEYLLGVKIQDDSIQKMLAGLGMSVSGDKPWKVAVPTFRPDLTREVDLIEEIARLHGLDNIPSDTQNAGPLVTPVHRRDTIREDLREIMTGFGFEETLGPGFAQAKILAEIDSSLPPIKILNPLSDDFGFLRTRLLYSLLISAGHNFRHRNVDIRIFEIGKVYRTGDSGPIEPEFFGCLLSGRSTETFWKSPAVPADFYDLKGIIAGLADSLNMGSFDYQPTDLPGYAEGCSFRIICRGNEIGIAGQVAPQLSRSLDIKQDTYAAEFSVAGLIAASQVRQPFEPLPKYPASSRDIAIIVDKSLPAGEVQIAIKSAGGELMESLNMFDFFVGQPVPEGKKSLAFSITFRAPDRTLEDAEIDTIYARITEHLAKEFHARLRE